MLTAKPNLAEYSFLRGLPAPYLDILADCAHEREFPAGEIVFREGEVADRFYIIVEGSVALESHVPPNGHLVVQTLGREEVLGWSWLFPPYVWHFQARALERTRVMGFNGAHLLIACEQNHEFGFDLMKRLAQVLIRRLQASQKQVVNLHRLRRPA